MPTSIRRQAGSSLRRLRRQIHGRCCARLFRLSAGDQDDTELTLVLDRWAIAAAGEGSSFYYSVSPISANRAPCRLMFSHIATEPHAEIRLRCSAYHVNSALYPVLRHLERTAGLAHEDLPSHRRERSFPDDDKAVRAVTLPETLVPGATPAASPRSWQNSTRRLCEQPDLVRNGSTAAVVHGLPL